MAMADAAVQTGVMLAADGTPLKKKLRQAQRRETFRALMLVAPLFLFIVFSFLAPIVWLLGWSFIDSDIAENMPKTVQALSTWDGKELPPEAAYQALTEDMTASTKAKTTALIGKRLNYEISGIRSKVIASGRKLSAITAPPYKDQVIAADPMWNDVVTWATLKRASATYTPFYLLAMLDLQQTPSGAIERVSPDRAIYVDVLLRTIGISLLVTLCTVILGYPVAYMLATLPQKTASILMIFVLLPFWTSLLVRTTAWNILTQDGGVITQFMHISGLTWFLNAVGLLDGPPQLVKTRFATIVAMTHIQLPFTLLPIYSVMKTISPSYMRAAKSLGATPFYAFLRVYMPQTLPGVAAGCLLTFILCLGYYITPALVGGPTDQMVSGFIYDAMNKENNWGKASALGAILLMATLILYYIYNKLIGIDRMKLG